ncbi:hypothetical protein [Pseudomonas sp. CCC2.2]|uniref:hypothetical protein n=1 Tax=Pseudomonas sp. CCC2.2 TaxID=3048605 RepID=UPI002B22F4BF|nr:hypothetical protein [Pseudomonas sp. CCC2.2]MEB0148565.1 hypothetical protein [Pseudomonas sp. CCC2.2]
MEFGRAQSVFGNSHWRATDDRAYPAGTETFSGRVDRQCDPITAHVIVAMAEQVLALQRAMIRFSEMHMAYINPQKEQEFRSCSNRAPL